MTQQRIKIIHRIYGILLALSLVVAGVCLAVACVGVYRTGEEPAYSCPEVAAAFAPIAVPVYLSVALALGGGVLHLLLPAEEERLRAPARPEVALARLYRRATLTEEQQAAVKKEQTARRLHRGITLVLGVGAAVVFLVYALNGTHFTTDVTGSVREAMWLLLPCLAVPFAYGVFPAYHNRCSRQRELAIVKTADLSAAPAESKGKGGFPVTAVRYALLTVGLLLLIYGFATGGIADVLTKAVNICTE